MNIKRTLRLRFADEAIDQAIYGYEIIGDILILSLKGECPERAKDMAQAILASHPQLRLVCRKVTEHAGEYRTVTLKKIGGQGDYVTLHKEFGLKLTVEPDKVYFSPRSSNERNRITRQVRAGERVLVMFSGIGPLPLMLGLHTRAAEIIGVEKNRHAHRLAEKNLQNNPGVTNVSFLEGDVRVAVPEITGAFDRIVLPLPLSGERFLTLALAKLRQGGMIHFYDFQRLENFHQAEQKVVTACQREARELLSSATVRCGHVGSKKYRVCVDAKIW